MSEHHNKTELEKWSNVHEDSIIIHEFLDFLSNEKILLCISNEYGFSPTFRNHEQLIYDHFKIDSDKLEQERRELLEKTRQAVKVC